MPQISFTKNNEQVYDRFSRLLLEEQLKRGKLTAPQFLDIILDGYLLYKETYELQEMDRRVEGISLRAYIADAEANDLELRPVVIRSTAASAMYLHKCFAHNNSYELTNWVDEAMVFDSPEQAKAFLKKTKRNEADWTFELVTESE